MRYGFIYTSIKKLLRFLNHLNLVELFKFIAIRLNKKKKDEEREKTFARIGIDIFICFKWTLIIFLSIFSLQSSLLTIFVWYLIFTNVYSYFYNHIWTDEALNTENFTKDRIRSRFLNLMLAIAYSTASFAYLYQIVYPGEFTWNNQKPNFLYSIQFSFSNSLAANYNQVQPFSDLGNLIANLQLIITFIFVAIIISRSIPQTTSKT